MVIKRKIIDISQFNNVTNWAKVKATKIPVIIRIGYRGSKTGVITYDPRYKEYRKACESNGIEHGFYFFPCSITDAEAHEEALFIKNEVLKSGIKMPVFLDSEVVQRDKSGRSDKLSKEKRTRMLRIICEDLLKWGIPCGIYASRSWLNNNIDMSQIPSDAVKNTWVAEYGVSMTRYTGYYVMWQFSSKEFVNGIDGVVDMSNQYVDFHMMIDGKETSVNHVIKTSSEPVKKTEKSEVEKIIEVAKGELGYLEKRSNSQLDSKTANVGDRNYVKYWSVKPEWNGAYWCGAFVCWVFTEALGKERAKQLLRHYPYVYCPTMAKLFKLYANPKVGDIVIFWRHGEFAHTGIVIAVDGDKFTTIEGNTSGASTIVANGGGVCQKTYYNSKLPGTKFCRPDYSSTTITSDTNKVVVADDMHTVKWKGYVNIGKNTKLAVRLQPNTKAKECSFSGLKQGTEVGVSHEDGNWYLIKYDGKFGYVQSQYIGKAKISEISNPDPVIDDIHTVKWNGIVNTKGGTLNVRIQPTTSAKTCSFSPLRKGTEVGVCHKDGNWYLIKYNGKYGYVYSSYVKRK